ncbi:MAG: hypothetical protein A2V66_17140 [Ignavibacteria bacterium RBG_13_36_8]|nr:MAG: hypothetical protein A2V66_17140 [Ignavibacteria bacterium RBG_13_36_8]
MRLFKKLKQLWKADTPLISQLAQIVLSTITAVFTLWATMPEEFKGIFTDGELKVIPIVGVISILLLQFTKIKVK